MARPRLSEEERSKGIGAFQKAHPDWDVVSNQTRCPKCQTLHYCRQHRWASRKWLSGIGVWMLSIKDHKLREELEKAGLI